MPSTKRLLWERRVCDWAWLAALVAIIILSALGFNPGHSIPQPTRALIGFTVGAALGCLFLRWDASIKRRVKAHPLYWLVLLQDEFGS